MNEQGQAVGSAVGTSASQAPRIGWCMVFLLAMLACRGDAPDTDEALAQGKLLYDHVQRTWPEHDHYELERQLIVRGEDTQQVMDMLALEPGMTVADIGCGSGFYTFLFSRAVGAGGLVYAIDIQQNAVDYLQQRLQDPTLNPLGNIRVFQSRVDATLIPDETLDAELLSHADFYAYPQLLDENIAMIQSCFDSLKPGGVLVVVQDMKVSWYSSGEQISKNFQAAGFLEERIVDLPGDQDLYFKFRKPGSK